MIIHIRIKKPQVLALVARGVGKFVSVTRPMRRPIAYIGNKLRFLKPTKKRLSVALHTLLVSILIGSILPLALMFSWVGGGKAEAATASQGPRTASASGNCVNDAGTGTVAWTSPGNAFSDNATNATVSVDGTTSNYIKCTNFGFSIPTGVTIAGFTMAIQRLANSTANGGSKDAAVRLVKGGTVGTTDKSTATLYTTSEVSENHGGTSDLWGTTWAASDVNASNFGAAIAVTKASATGAAHTVSVDVVTITVTYSFSPTFGQSSYRWFNDTTANSTYAKYVGTASDETVNDSVRTSDGGYAVTGMTTEISADGEAFIAKFNPAGVLSWMKTWGDTSTGSIDKGYGIDEDSSGNLIITGVASGFGTSPTFADIFTAKYSSSGSLQWSRMWSGTSTYEEGRGVAVTSDGGYVIAGFTNGITGGFGSNDVALVKYASDGTLSWSKVWGGSGTDIGRAIEATSDGGFAITGTTTSFAAYNELFIAKYTSGGSLSWSTTTGLGYGEEANDIIVLSDGRYAIVGNSSDYGIADYGTLFIFSSSGVVQLFTIFGTASSYTAVTGAIELPSGDLVVSGVTDENGAGSYDAFVAKISTAGTMAWSKTFGGSSSDGFRYSKVMTDGTNITIASSTSSFGHGNSDILNLQYDSTGAISGCSSPTCQAPSIPASNLSNVYTSQSASSPAVTPSTSSPTSTVYDSASTVTNGYSSSVDVGSSLAAQDTATTGLAEQSILRLRMNVHVSSQIALAGSYFSFKLQYAPRGADNVCDTSFVNESANYADVTTSTSIAYADNTGAVDGQTLTTNANDPTHSTDTLVRQEYNESNNTNVVNTIQAGEDGMFDFALKDNGAAASTAYCFRLVDSTGSTLSSYSVVPQLTTIAPNMSQENYRWYKGQDAVPNNTFVQTWGGTSIDWGRSMVKTTDGGYAVTGSNDSYGAGSSDMYIAKYTSAGTLSWSKTWGGTSSEEGYSIIQTKDGGYAVSGGTSTYSLPGSATDMFLAKYTSTGTLSWSRTWGGTGDEHAYSVVQASDGGYAVLGTTDSFGAGLTDMFLAKYTSAGTLSWSKTWGGTSDEYAGSVVQTSEGGYAVTGNTSSFGAGSSDMFLVKLDSTGTLSWSKTWGDTGSDSGSSVVQTTDGGYAVSGYTDSYGAGAGDMFLAKYTSAGTLSWSKTWGGTSIEGGSSVVQTSDDGYAVTGNTSSFGVGNNDVFLAKYTSAGTLSWSNTWGGTDYEEVANLVQTPDGGYATAGVTLSYGAGMDDMFLAKYDSAGTITGCNSTMCTADTVGGGADYTSSTSSPSPSTSSPSPSTSSPSPSTSSPSPSTSSPSPSVSLLAGHMTFAKTWGGTGADIGNSVVTTSDGGYAVTGYTANFGAVSEDMFLAKYDSSGTLSWSRTWGGTGVDHGQSLIQTSDGGYAVTGFTNSYGNGLEDMFLAKYDSSGTLSWSRTWGGSDSESGTSLVATSDGGYTVTGSSNSWSAASYYDLFLVKFDSTGTIVFGRIYTTGQDESGNSLIATSDGGYAVTGSTPAGAGSTDMFLAKYDSAGTISWYRTWGGTGADFGNSVVTTSDGGYAVTGYTANFGAVNEDMFLAKYDSSGTLSWSRTWGGTGADIGNSLVTTSDGGYAVAGRTSSYGAGSNDMFLAKYESSGTLSWSRTWGGTGADYGNSLVTTSDGGYAISGYTAYGAGGSDMVLAKTDSRGMIAGCSSPMCQSPTATTSSPTASTSSPSAPTIDYAPGTSSPTATTSSPSPTDSFQVTRGLWTDLAPIPSSTLGAQDTAGSSSRHDDPLRLRIILKNSKRANASQLSMKLQVSPRVGTCDASFTGETYADLSGSTAFNYYNNPNLSNGDWAPPGASDPAPVSGTTYFDNYQETSSITNRRSLVGTQNALWDISVSPTDGALFNSYCFRLVNTDNSLLTGYSRIFEVSIPPASKQQMRHGKFIDEQGGTGRQPFYW